MGLYASEIYRRFESNDARIVVPIPQISVAILVDSWAVHPSFCRVNV